MITLISIAHLSKAQSEKDQVMKPIYDLFQAMETNDSTLAASVFTDEAMLHTIFIDKTGTVQKRATSVSALTSAFGKPKDQIWTEPIWNEQVLISGELASVWVDYAFYVDKTFSHCGVDAFHLIKTDSGWKIFHLADTRQKEGCQIPDEIKRRYY